MSRYKIYDTKRKLVVFDESDQEFWLDSITVKVEQEGRTAHIVRVRAQNVQTNELTEWKEFVGVIDPIHEFLKTFNQK